MKPCYPWLLALIGLLALRAPAWADAPPCRYTVSADTVYDTFTKLTWQRAVPAAPVATGCSGTSCTQAGAMAYCAGLSLGGMTSGWRLPRVSELLTIVDPTTVSPAIDPTAFPNTPSDGFWSSSPRVDDPGYAWLVIFGGGDRGSTDSSSTYRVRCVR